MHSHRSALGTHYKDSRPLMNQNTHRPRSSFDIKDSRGINNYDNVESKVTTDREDQIKFKDFYPPARSSLLEQDPIVVVDSQMDPETFRSKVQEGPPKSI